MVELSWFWIWLPYFSMILVFCIYFLITFFFICIVLMQLLRSYSMINMYTACGNLHYSYMYFIFNGTWKYMKLGNIFSFFFLYRIICICSWENATWSKILCTYVLTTSCRLLLSILGMIRYHSLFLVYSTVCRITPILNRKEDILLSTHKHV